MENFNKVAKERKIELNFKPYPALSKIAGLRWYPYVGKNYENVMIIGESHYINENTEEESIDRQNYLDNLKELTVVNLDDVIVKENWRNPTYLNMIDVLRGEESSIERKDVLSKISYYNLIQRHLSYNPIERPLKEDYIEGWKCFLEIESILKPSFCLVIGVESSKNFTEYMNVLGAKVDGFTHKEMINNTYPRVCKVKINDREIDFCFIKHTSKYISPLHWHQFIKDEYPNVINNLIQV